MPVELRSTASVRPDLRPRRAKRRPARSTIPLLCLAALSACTTPEPRDVQRQWSDTFRGLGITPIYPPREDVQVGDVYVRRWNPADPQSAPAAGQTPADVLLTNVSTGDTVREFYRTRADFPNTGEGARSASTDALAASPSALNGTTNGGRYEPATGEHGATHTAPDVAGLPRRPHSDSGSIFTDFRTDSLRQVAFPEFTRVTVEGGSARAFVPVEALAIAGAASFDGASTMVVKIPSGESYALPAAVLLRELLDTSGPRPRLAEDVVAHGWLASMASSVNEWRRQRGLPPLDALYLDVVTEVYYTRHIDVGLWKRDAAGADAEVAALDSLVRESARTDGDGPTAAEASGFARAREANEELRRQFDDRRLGGDVRFTYVSESAIGMKRIYERPIAVGYRGVTLAVDPKTGVVRGIGAGPGPVEEFAGEEAIPADEVPADEIVDVPPRNSSS